MKHSKHSKLQKPEIGAFGRNEIAILGTTCEEISVFVNNLISNLDKNLNISYIDADHKAEEEILESNTLQDKISHIAFETKNRSQNLQKYVLNDQDLILINGNHFEGKKQIVFIDPKKEESLKKRIKQLTNVLAIVILEKASKPYTWLSEILTDNIPVFHVESRKEMADFVLRIISKPKLKALILKGGQSQRMGEDKSQLMYRNISQEAFLKQEFESLNIEVFVSESIQSHNVNVISDTFTGLGPYGGILSAFREDPNAAWLVIACDLPLITAKEIKQLVNNRNLNTLATACHNPETDFPDPLFTIWEPKAYPVLLNYLSQGYSCPRKVLINENIELIHLVDANILKNCNTPKERDEVMQVLK
jgi:molybdenum cofactor guanylyltransferase